MSDSLAPNVSGRLRARTDGESSRPASEKGSDGSHNATEHTLKKVLGKRISVLRRQYTERSRAEASAEKQTNKEELSKALNARLRISRQAKSLPIKRTAAVVPNGGVPSRVGGLPATIIKNTVLGQGSQQILAGTIPKATTVPFYKSWTYLMRNEIAVEVGRKMFYTDSTGETIPASDSEEEPKGDSTLEGIYREREQWVVTQIIREYGQTPEVVHVLANKINSTPGAIESVISEELEHGALSGGQTLEGLLDEKFISMFCRRCRTYNCLTHESPQVRPMKKPAVLDESSKPRNACGPNCWRRSVPQLLLGGLSAAVSAVSKGPEEPSGGDAAGDLRKQRPPKAPSLPAAGDLQSSKRLREDAGAVEGGATKRGKSRFAEEAAALAIGVERPLAGVPSSTARQPVGTARQPLDLAQESVCLSGSSAEPSRARQLDVINHSSSSSEDVDNKVPPVNAVAEAVTSLSRQAVEMGELPTSLAPGSVASVPRSASNGGKPANLAITSERTASASLVKSPPRQRSASVVAADESRAANLASPATSRENNALSSPLRSPNCPVTGAKLVDICRSPALRPASKQAVKPEHDAGEQGMKCAAQSLKADEGQADEASAGGIKGELLSRQASAASTAAAKSAVKVDHAALTSTPMRKRRQPGANGALERTAATAEGEQTEADSPVKPGGWDTFEIEVLQRGGAMFGQDACKLARLIGSRTCAEVAEELGLNDRQAAGDANEGDELGAAPLKAYRGRGKGKPLSLRKRAAHFTLTSKRRQHKEALWDAYTPCNCQGGCGKDCACLDSKHFCEKFCACWPSCPQAFAGCVCSSGCRFKSCPCVAAGHECNPDLCKGCTHVVLGEPPPVGKDACCNMRLRLRQHKRLAVGLSTVAGWGAFLLEGAHKNELLGEYTGELIDQTEADRRGKVYDRDDNSYLFNLNNTWVIDARSRGNKLRFANHSTDPNCRAEILMVDGDHRVGIFASRNIAAGSELFYDYRYDHEQAPAWARDGTDP